MLLVRNISQLVTLKGQRSPRRKSAMSSLGLVEKAAVLIEGERIRAVGTQEEVESLAEAQNAACFDAGDCAVLPGFCDSHTHPVFAGTRQDEYEQRIQGADYRRIAATGGGIMSSVRRLREMPESELVDLTLARAEDFLRYGTSFIEAKSGYGLNLDAELKMLRVILEISRQTPLQTVSTFLGGHGIPPEYRHDREGYLRLLCEEMIPAVADSGLADACDVFCEESAFTVDESRRILEAAMRRGLSPRVHADQFSASGGTLLGVALGAVSVDHADRVGEEEIFALAQSDTVATLLPGAVFHLGSNTYAPARKMIDAGVAVALATDFNPGSAPGLNMQMTLSLACARMGMSCAEVLTAATMNGACAMRKQDLVGSIEPGKQADLFISTVSDYRLIPYHFGMNHCRALIKKGRVL